MNDSGAREMNNPHLILALLTQIVAPVEFRRPDGTIAHPARHRRH
jgi:hypothetical protein